MAAAATAAERAKVVAARVGWARVGAVMAAVATVAVEEFEARPTVHLAGI